jgi:hypothetical protein
MGWWRSTRDVPPPPPPPPPARPPVLLATVDTLPWRYEILGLVHASEQVAATGYFPTDALLDRLASAAASIGADAVTGVQMSQTFIPGMSRERVLGQVTDHFGGVVRATALGTAVRRLSSAKPGRPGTYGRAHAR